MSAPLAPPAKSTLAKYNLTEHDWYRLLNATDGLCPACHKRFTQGRRPCIDHNHRTFMVRGLVCSPCNQSIGFHHDDVAWFTNVALYLDTPTADTIAGTLQGTARLKDAP